MKFIAPERLNQPDGHGNGNAVVLGQYLPAGQVAQGNADDSTNWPREQDVHAKEPDRDIDPEGQD